MKEKIDSLFGFHASFCSVCSSTGSPSGNRSGGTNDGETGSEEDNHFTFHSIHCRLAGHWCGS